MPVAGEHQAGGAPPAGLRETNAFNHTRGGGTSARRSVTWVAKQLDGVRGSAALGKVPASSFVEGNFTPEGATWRGVGLAVPSKNGPPRGERKKGDGHSSSCLKAGVSWPTNHNYRAKPRHPLTRCSDLIRDASCWQRPPAA